MKTFSVVIPSRDRPQQLAACLDALTKQDYPRQEFEVIVVDDGGRVSARETAAPFASRLDLRVVRQSWAGPAVARNSGARLAEARFLCFTDSDCLPDPEWLRSLETRFDSTPDAVVGGQTLNGTPGNVYTVVSQLILDAVHHCFNEKGERHLLFPPTNLSVATEAFRRFGGFDPRLEVSEDRDFCDRWRRLGGTFEFAPEAVVAHTHLIGLLGFLRRNLSYGRGAHRFHRSTGRDKAHGELSALSFYPFLFWHVVRSGRLFGAPVRLSLVVVARIVYVLGYLTETVLRFLATLRRQRTKVESR